MIQRQYSKLCNAEKLTKEIIAAGLPQDPTAGARFYGVVVNTSAEGSITLVLCYDDITQQETDIIDTLVSNHIPTPYVPTNVVVTDGPNFIASLADKTWVIPSGQTLTITKFCASGNSEACGRASLLYDPDGDAGSNMVTIDAIYVQGNSDCHDITNTTFTGDGTALIRLRRETACTGGSNNMFARWEGNY